MNISQLARALIGGNQVNVKDAQALELKVGQIVRGVVLQMLEGSEALVSINGTQVRASLETPLQTGQSTLLQVSHQSSDGQLILKTAVGGSAAADALIMKLMQELGLKDTPTNRELVRLASEMNMTLTGKDARALADMAARQGSAADAKWMQSALLTLQRGLPLTQQTLAAIGQVVHGKPLPQLLQTLLGELTQTLQQPTGQSEGGHLDASTRQLLSQLTQAIRNWFVLAGGSSQASADAPSTGQGGQSPQSGSNAQNHPATGTSSSGIIGQATDANAAQAGRSSVQPTTGSVTNATGQSGVIPAATQSAAQTHGGRTGAAQPEALPSNGLGSSAATAPTMNESMQRLPLSSMQDGDRSMNSGNAGTGREQTTSANSQQASQGLQLNGSLMRQLLHALGMNHEHELMDKLIWQAQSGSRDGTAGHSAPSSGGAAALPSEPAWTAQQAQQAVQQTVAAESIKSLLLQAAGNEQLAGQVRDTIQQAAQAITGQQLLLTADRAAPLSYVTLFVPFLNEKGEHMASVHIQTRKGKRGDLDSNNCHLFFDLNLNALGSMMIDVQVTDRIVALRIHNDHPLIQTLIEEGRQDMTQALERMGYRLSSVKTAPLPQQEDVKIKDDGEPLSDGQSFMRSYAAGMAYKGVDLRI